MIASLLGEGATCTRHQALQRAPRGLKIGYSQGVDDRYRQRAQARRATWEGGVAASHAQMEEADLRFWQQASAADRLNAVWQMALEFWTLQGNDGPPPRLRGSSGGVRRGEG
jgi:hypothetical protein